MSDFKEILNNCNQNNINVGKALPNEIAGFMQLHDAALEAGSLDTKTKELIALGISIAIKCEPCIASHMDSLIKLNVTREEVLETIGVAFFMGGGPSLAYGGKALEAFEQLSK